MSIATFLNSCIMRKTFISCINIQISKLEPKVRKLITPNFRTHSLDLGYSYTTRSGKGTSTLLESTNAMVVCLFVSVCLLMHGQRGLGTKLQTDAHILKVNLFHKTF